MTRQIHIPFQAPFNEIDIQFTKTLLSFARPETINSSVIQTILLTSNSLTNFKNVCLDLNYLASGYKTLADWFFDEDPEQKKELQNYRILCDNPETIKNKLLETGIVGTPEQQKDSKTPLVLDANNNKIYLYRYWNYEKELSDIIKKSVQTPDSNYDIMTARNKFNAYLEFMKSIKPHFQMDDLQKIAVFLALEKQFAIISGGPGTGKTTIAAAIISILLDISDKKPLISVCAPTGKASARIKESIAENMDEKHKILFPPEASTIHRLLGYMPKSNNYTYNQENPLQSNIIILDEASMVSLSQMTKLLRSVNTGTKIIMLGDKDQLASVDSGAVFGDICASADPNKFTANFLDKYDSFTANKLINKEKYVLNNHQFSSVQGHIVQLDKNHRFGSREGITIFAKTINCRDKQSSVSELLMKEDLPEKIKDSVFISALPPQRNLKKNLYEFYIKENNFISYLFEKDIGAAFSKFESLKILCAVRKGYYGTENLNNLSEEIIRDQFPGLFHENINYYRGKPLMILQNDYTLKLFNGDIGIIWPDHDGALKAFFKNPDYTETNDEEKYLIYPPSRLPPHETVFAMTVHKAQGSGFNTILFILPEKDNPVLTKELVYTAVTRAKEKIVLWIDKDVFIKASSSLTLRNSGLKDILHKDENLT